MSSNDPVSSGQETSESTAKLVIFLVYWLLPNARILSVILWAFVGTMIIPAAAE